MESAGVGEYFLVGDTELRLRRSIKNTEISNTVFRICVAEQMGGGWVGLVVEPNGPE